MSATVLLQDGKGPCGGGGVTMAGLRQNVADDLDAINALMGWTDGLGVVVAILLAGLLLAHAWLQ